MRGTVSSLYLIIVLAHVYFKFVRGFSSCIFFSDSEQCTLLLLTSTCGFELFSENHCTKFRSFAITELTYISFNFKIITYEQTFICWNIENNLIFFNLSCSRFTTHNFDFKQCSTRHKEGRLGSRVKIKFRIRILGVEFGSGFKVRI